MVDVLIQSGRLVRLGYKVPGSAKPGTVVFHPKTANVVPADIWGKLRAGNGGQSAVDRYLEAGILVELSPEEAVRFNAGAVPSRAVSGVIQPPAWDLDEADDKPPNAPKIEEAFAPKEIMHPIGPYSPNDVRPPPAPRVV